MATRDSRRRGNRSVVTDTRTSLQSYQDTETVGTARLRVNTGSNGSANEGALNNHRWYYHSDRPYSGPNNFGSYRGNIKSRSWFTDGDGVTWRLQGGYDSYSGGVYKGTRTVTKTRPVTESYTRYQALDKRSGDPDDQKVRDLKTKRDGRNKLRIQLTGDVSAGRLQGGPNTDRKRNKLKIDVQGGGQAGLNIPR